MGRFIDRYKTIDALNQSNKDPIDVVFEMQDAADVRENVKGEWIVDKMHDTQYGKVKFRCSVCGIPYALEHRQGARVGWNFCPSCGADMRGGDAE